MAIVHQTVLTPSKLELVTSWLPRQPWYRGATTEPALSKTGGFRLDDPAGEVGIEFMLLADGVGVDAVTYLVPLTYRGAPLHGADDALVGTMEHGVLGRRWAYDGLRDPVLVAELLALIEGRAQAQDQNLSDTPDRQVSCSSCGDLRMGTITTVDTEDGTELLGADGLSIRVCRVPQAVPTGASLVPKGAVGHVSGVWRAGDGGPAHGLFAVVLPTTP
ncbi:maltokinase N-terminal cap-like domain-containing protein [Stackebrandtia soli]|uniref:maltokinase N-terminal cap-like domain-containing protein n=1 Tax=Stackebrandtia soli TaxID=1892856 RepID=UPI0039ECFDB1